MDFGMEERKTRNANLSEGKGDQNKKKSDHDIRAAGPRPEAVMGRQAAGAVTHGHGGQKAYRHVRQSHAERKTSIRSPFSYSQHEFFIA